jgi:hypothetical protein
MPNVTISIDAETLRAGREYARLHKTSLNALIRQLLEQRVLQRSADWVDECFAQMDAAGGSSRGQAWARDELYDV